MFARLSKSLDRRIGLDSLSDRDGAQLSVRISALRTRMPWVYAILIVNLFGVLITIDSSSAVLRSPGFLLVVTLVWRLIHWLRVPGSPLEPASVRSEVRRLYVVGGFIAVFYCVWLFALYGFGAIREREHIILFGSLAALGVANAVDPIPGVARIPLYGLAVPLALLLVATGDPSFIAMGMTLAVLVIVAIQLNKVGDKTLTNLIDAHFDTQIDKLRAEQAEKSAVAERSLARKLAATDPLTALANRRGLLAEIDERAAKGGPIAMALFDLDGFKPINDTFGHPSGDAVLVAVARRLEALVGKSGLAARLGGDEFAILLDGSNRASVSAVVAQAVERIREPYMHGGRSLVVSACAGIAFIDPAQGDATQLIRMADIALYTAKGRGRGSIQLFSSALEAEVKRRAAIEVALRSPGVEDDIELAYQPIVDLGSMTVRSFEALARWRHSELGWISPSEFIPITEQISLVEQISDALLTRAAREAARWPGRTCLSFNLSGVQLCSVGSGERVIELVRAAGLEPTRLQIEVTETALLADFDAARRNLSHLRDHGVHLVLDDFGAGYASISYLSEMRFDAVKLDGSLITAAAQSDEGLALLKGVLDLCRAVKLPCVAEHVEDRAQATTLRELGCRFGQGFWLGRPMSPAGAMRLAQSDVVRLAPGLAGGSWPEDAERLRTAG